MTLQESLAGSAWDFGPVFAALAKPYTNEDQKEQSGYFKHHSTPIPSLSRAASGHVDKDETPKATPVEEPISTLGDLSNALLCLGYSVEITAPTGLEDAPLATTDIDVNSSPNETSLSKHEAESNVKTTEEDLSQRDLEETKLAAKRAENRRRNVLQSFLGSSDNDNLEDGASQKPPKQKTDSILHHKNAALKFKPSNVLSSARKHVDMSLSAEKKIQLTVELHKRFPGHLNSFYHSGNIPGSIPSTEPEGIHVFVDISNILIGFHDTLKQNRQIDRQVRVPRQTLSFHNLSIILERGRPVAKRFLAGSDDIDCIQEARALGYTTHILQRVDKIELAMLPGKRKGIKSGLTSSDTDSGTSRRMKRAEQAVDEVLHLGMLQSLLDADKPSTIVLASGDAAKAEFSDGFLKQVERALLKGWSVEVIAFRATTGSAYRDPMWTSRWRESFKLIPLDHFTEMLHVPYEGSRF